MKLRAILSLITSFPSEPLLEEMPTRQLPVKSAEGTVDNNASQQWFPMFKLEDNNSKHKSRLGRPSTKDNEVMSQAAEENTSTSIRACQHSSALLKTLSFGICPSSDAAANV